MGRSLLRFETYYVDGLAYKSQGDYPAALEAFSAALINEPSHRAECCFEIGDIYERQQKTEEALRAYRMALSYNPSFTAAQRRLDALLLGEKKED